MPATNTTASELNTHLIWLIAFILLWLIEVFLSHQNGYKSGEESQALAKILHISSKTIRLAAHIFLFAMVMFLGLMAFPEHKIYIIAAVLLWAILDEATKPLLHNYRHSSVFDMGMNMIGIMIGLGIKAIMEHV